MVCLGTTEVGIRVETIRDRVQRVVSLNMKKKKRRKRKKKRRMRSFRKFGESMSLLKLTLLSASPRSYVPLGKLRSFSNKHRPSSSETEDIVKLFDAGMSCARINLSHGTSKVNLILIQLL